MTAVQWLFHYKIAQAQIKKDSEIKIETLKTIISISQDFFSDQFKNSSEFISFFSSRPEAMADYLSKQKMGSSTNEADFEQLQKAFEAFPDEILVEIIQPVKTPVLKKINTSDLGIKKR